MSIEIKTHELRGARELLKAKMFAYLVNPTLSEHNNVIAGMTIFEAVVADHNAAKRRIAKGVPYAQQAGRAKRNPRGHDENSGS